MNVELNIFLSRRTRVAELQFVNCIFLLNFQCITKFPLGVILENTEKEEKYKCICGECCKQYDKHAIQISLAQGSALCACGMCEVRVDYDNGKFTHKHTERIFWGASKLGTDTNTLSFY